MRGWPWRHDLRRVRMGLGRALRAAREEQPDAGIGTFAAASAKAGTRRANRYGVTLACAAAEAREVVLVIDVYAVDQSGAASSHVGYAVKRMSLPPRRAVRVDICARWPTAVMFRLEGDWQPADELWTGEPADRGFLSVATDLRDATGRTFDRTVIYQEVGEEPAGLERSDEPVA